MCRKVQVELSEKQNKISLSLEFLDDYLENNDKPVYGINTGFGSLYSVKILKIHFLFYKKN